MPRKLTVSKIFIVLVVSVIALLCLAPILLILMTSMASERAITMYGYTLWPKEWSFEAYRQLLNPASKVSQAYWTTIQVTTIGTTIATLITYGAGYTLSNPQCRYRNGLALFFFIPMVFSAGLIPWYMMNKTLGFYDNIWALIVPTMMFSPFNMFLTRNFLRGIPESLRESAMIDGAGDLRVAVQIYAPLAKPVLATIMLFYGVAYWNDYMNAVLLINSDNQRPLQMLLFSIQSELAMVSQMMVGAEITPPKESFKMATSIITIGPIIMLYPLLQRHFIKGMVIGAVKG